MNFLIEKLENARITLNRMIESDDEDVDSDIWYSLENNEFSISRPLER